MPDDVIYYAVVSGNRTTQNPSGLARRRHLQAGGFEDEALSKDLTWKHTSAVVESKQGRIWISNSLKSARLRLKD